MLYNEKASVSFVAIKKSDESPQLVQLYQTLSVHYCMQSLQATKHSVGGAEQGQ